MSVPSINELNNNPAYRPLKELRFSDILMFVLEQIRYTNFFSVFYLISNIIFLSLFAGIAVYGFIEEILTLKSFLFCFGWGILAGSLLIIPVHEGFHALAFLMAGAKMVKFGADIKQMIFYATAENFVAGRKSFTMVALAPFVMINLISIPFAIYGNIELRLFVIVMLLLHNLMCIGDFAMMSFYRKHNDKEIYTFDDTVNKTAWFYEKI